MKTWSRGQRSPLRFRILFESRRTNCQSSIRALRNRRYGSDFYDSTIYENEITEFRSSKETEVWRVLTSMYTHRISGMKPTIAPFATARNSVALS